MRRRGPDSCEDAAVIRVESVHKRYGRGRSVLAGVDLTVRPGQVVLVAGANGSGKSTLLRIVAGCVRPTRGRVVGRPRHVGYVPDRFPARLRMPVTAYLRHMAALRRVPEGQAAARAALLLEDLGFTGEPEAPMAQLSKGNAQKVGLVQALCAPVGLLVLDEPWSGLDAGAQPVLTEQVRAAAQAGAMVLVTDHTGRACELPGVVVRRLVGGVLVDGDAATDATGAAGAGSVAVRYVELGCPEEAVAGLAGLPGVLETTVVPGGVGLRVDVEASDAVLAEALRRGCSVRRVQPVDEVDGAREEVR